MYENSLSGFWRVSSMPALEVQESCAYNFFLVLNSRLFLEYTCILTPYFKVAVCPQLLCEALDPCVSGAGALSCHSTVAGAPAPQKPGPGPGLRLPSQREPLTQPPRSRDGHGVSPCFCPPPPGSHATHVSCPWSRCIGSRA